MAHAILEAIREALTAALYLLAMGVVSAGVLSLLLMIGGLLHTVLWRERPRDDGFNHDDDEPHGDVSFPPFVPPARRSRSGASLRAVSSLPVLHHLQDRKRGMGRPDLWLASNGDYLTPEDRMKNKEQAVAARWRMPAYLTSRATAPSDKGAA